MSNYGPRMPLHMQNPAVHKAIQENNSYESFRPNAVHPSGAYNEMAPGDRADIPEQFRIRRYPSGELDLMYVANQVIDAIHKLEYNGTTGNPNYGSASLLPLEAALLTVVLPAKYRKMEPQQAEIMTQLSATEKRKISMIVDQQMANEDNWNAGRGGGAVPGARPNNVGG